jgi:predicted nucleic acid-binding protein
VRELVSGALVVLPFDEAAAAAYGSLRAELESDGTTLAEPDNESPRSPSPAT